MRCASTAADPARGTGVAARRGRRGLAQRWKGANAARTLILSAHQLGSTLADRAEFRTAARDAGAAFGRCPHHRLSTNRPARWWRATRAGAGGAPARLDSNWSWACRTPPISGRRAGRHAARTSIRWPACSPKCRARLLAGLQRLQPNGRPSSAPDRSFPRLARSLWSEATEELCAAFGIDARIGKAEPEDHPGGPSAAWLSRARQFNDAVLRLLAPDRDDPATQLWRKLLGEIKVPGAPIAPGSLSALSKRFEADIRALCKAHPGLEPGAMKRDRKCADWQEADPGQGFRATQYLMAFQWRIKQAKAEMQSKAPISPDACRGWRPPDRPGRSPSRQSRRTGCPPAPARSCRR